MTVDELKARIETVTDRPFRGANGRCPAHDDAHESLSVNQGDVAPVLTCHAGCATGEVLAALGLTLADLFDAPGTNGKRPSNEPEAVYRYTDERGELLFEVYRFPGKKFCQRAANGAWKLDGVRRVLYHLPEVAQAIFEAEPIWITEGEKDAEALVRAGIVATCNPGGAGKWRVEFTESLRNAELVIIVADRDEAGRAHARQVADALRDVVHEVRIVEPAVGKDAFDHLAAGRSVEEFVELGLGDAEANVGGDVSTPAPVAGALPVWSAYVEGKLTVVDNPWLLDKTAIGKPLPPPPNARFLRDRLAPRADGPDLPEFPTELLPRPVAEMVEAVSVALQVPADMPAMLALAMLATATCGRLQVNAGPEWSEMTNLFVAVLAEPAGRKSQTFKKMVAPIRAAERRLQETMGPQVRRAEAEAEIALEQSKKAKTVKERWEAKEALAAIGDPKLPRLLADDTTPEELGTLLADQGGRLAVLSAEGTILKNVAGRYTKPGAAPAFTELLAGHANDAILLDRVSRSSKRCDNPALTLGLAVQPEVILQLTAAQGARGLGVIARFLFARPRERTGYQTLAQRPIPDAVTERYDRLVQTMVETFWWQETPVVVGVNERAGDMLADFFDHEVQPALRLGGDLAALKDWGGKLHGAVVRIAGLLQAASSLSGARAGLPLVVGVSAMSAAIEIGRYLIPHAVHVFGERAPSTTDRETAEDVMRALAWAQRSGRKSFDHRDLQRSQRGWSADRAKAACVSIPDERGRHWKDGATVHVELV